MKQWLCGVAQLTLALGALSGANAAADSRPIVLELYTSEGCSSCPPAEALIGEWARRADILALAFHVDYWDGLGWRDRYGLPSATQRQRGWAQSRAGAEVFTPQMIVDGRQSVLGSDRAAVAAAVHTAQSRLAAESDVIVTALVSGGQVLIEVAGGASRRTKDVYIVAYLPHTVTQIPRGENAGRTVQESNVVRSILKLGSVAGAATRWQLAASRFPSDASKVAVLVQDAQSGAVSAAQVLNLR